MIIKKELFGDCFCPTAGIGRVCLRGDRDIPEELVQIAQEIDGNNFLRSCFAIDVSPGCATINYSAEHGFVELGYNCENRGDVLSHYINNASPMDIKETFSDWDT